MSDFLISLLYNKVNVGIKTPLPYNQLGEI